MKQSIYILVLLSFLSLPFGLIAQNPITAALKVSKTNNSNDTTLSDSTLKIVATVNIQNINDVIQRTEEIILQAKEIHNQHQWVAVDSFFTEKEQFIDEEAEDFWSYNQPNLSKFFLQNLRLSWANYDTEIKKLQVMLDDELAKTINQEKLLLNKKDLLSTFHITLKKDSLISLNSRVSFTIGEIDTLLISLNSNKKQLLNLQSRISEKDILCKRVSEEIEVLNSQLRGKTFTRTQSAIWNIELDSTIQGGLVNSFKRAYRNNSKSISYYYSNLTDGIALYLFIMSFILFIVLYIRKRYIALEYDKNTPGYASVERVLIHHPKVTLFSFAVIFWIIIFPFIPTMLSDIFFLAILAALSIILRSFIDKTGKKLLLTLSILLLLNVFEVVIWYLGDYSRIYLLAETTVALIIIFPYLAIYKERKDIEKSRIVIMAKRFLPFILAAYAIAFLGNLFGYVNLSVLFIKIGIRTAAITLIAYGYMRILENIFFASLSVLELRFPDIVINYGIIINKRAKNIIKLVVFYLWSDIILHIFEIDIIVRDWLTKVLTAEANIGTISLSLSDILLFTGILYITYMLASFVKTILEGEILRKMKLPRGMPAAISMIVRIFMVTIGITFALSATGIDMSSFGMLAGALGVGIGFGLQNIVQNFISGLILIFERPIQVGDTVEVNNLLGKVKDIGVRASNVVTYDGAEVVVPNSNLISNDLINWTLSDSRKRVEIKVGTAYGTDPNLVLELIQKVAVDHPDVEKNPPPRALFEGFGDSSLDFRLLFWVNFELGLGAKSDIAVGIYNVFRERNIEIPFPQIDLHVKDLPNKSQVVEKKQPTDTPKTEDNENAGKPIIG